MPTIYLTLDQAVEVHRRTVRVSGGGIMGMLNMDMLESILNHIQNDDYYPTFEDKLTYLFFSACKLHCFADGNKRIAISLGGTISFAQRICFYRRSFYQRDGEYQLPCCRRKHRQRVAQKNYNGILERKRRRRRIKIGNFTCDYPAGLNNGKKTFTRTKEPHIPQQIASQPMAHQPVRY